MVLHCTASRSCPLLSILRQELGLSSGLVKRLKYDGAFQVNGTVARTNHPVVPGDVITVTLQDTAPEYPAEDFPIQVLYEDEAILAVDKPSGLIIHPSAARNTGTLANRVLGYYRRTEQACAFHPLTRLDRDTFGVVLLAKNAHIHARLCQSLQASRKNLSCRRLWHASVPIRRHQCAYSPAGSQENAAGHRSRRPAGSHGIQGTGPLWL